MHEIYAVFARLPQVQPLLPAIWNCWNLSQNLHFVNASRMKSKPDFLAFAAVALHPECWGHDDDISDQGRNSLNLRRICLYDSHACRRLVMLTAGKTARDKTPISRLG